MNRGRLLFHPCNVEYDFQLRLGPRRPVPRRRRSSAPPAWSGGEATPARASRRPAERRQERRLRRAHRDLRHRQQLPGHDGRGHARARSLRRAGLGGRRHPGHAQPRADERGRGGDARHPRVRRRIDALVQVGDAKNLVRTLLLTLQIAELGIPFCLDLNMLDEARARGLSIDLEALARELPRRHGERVDRHRGRGARRRSRVPRRPPRRRATAPARASALACAPRFPDDIEAAIADVAAHLDDALPVARRAIATMLLAGERGVGGTLLGRGRRERRGRARREGARASASRGRTGVPVFALLSRLRLVRAQAIVRAVAAARRAPRTRGATRGSVGWPRVDRRRGGGVARRRARLRRRDRADRRAVRGRSARDVRLLRRRRRACSRARSSRLEPLRRSASSRVGDGVSARSSCGATRGVAPARGSSSPRSPRAGRRTGWRPSSSGLALHAALVAARAPRGRRRGSSLCVLATRAGDRRDAALSQAIGRVATRPGLGPAHPRVRPPARLQDRRRLRRGDRRRLRREAHLRRRARADDARRAGLRPRPSTQSDFAAPGTEAPRRLAGRPGDALRIVAQSKARTASYVARPRRAHRRLPELAADASTDGGGAVVVEATGDALRGAQARVWSGSLNRWAYGLLRVDRRAAC